jgi:hypothetical protein
MGFHGAARPPFLVQRLSHEAAALIFPSFLPSFTALYRRLTTWHLGLPVSSEIEKLHRVTLLFLFIPSPSERAKERKSPYFLFVFPFGLACVYEQRVARTAVKLTWDCWRHPRHRHSRDRT